MKSNRSSEDSLNDQAGKKKKRLCFDESAKVLLIPTINDYRRAGIFESLWHEPQEMEYIRSDAEAELRRFMEICGLNDRRKALRILWR